MRLILTLRQEYPELRCEEFYLVYVRSGVRKESFAACGGERFFGWRLCKKVFTALRAELCFERHVVLTISLREIVKMTCLSK